MAQGWVTKFYSDFTTLPDGPLLGQAPDVSVAPNGSPAWGTWPVSDPGVPDDPGVPFWEYWDGETAENLTMGWNIVGGKLYNDFDGGSGNDLPIPFYLTNDWWSTGVKFTITLTYEDMAGSFNSYPMFKFWYVRESDVGVGWSELFWEYIDEDENTTYWRDYGPFDGDTATPPNPSLEFGVPGQSPPGETVTLEYILDGTGVRDFSINGVSFGGYSWFAGGYNPVPGQPLYPALSTDNDLSLGAFGYTSFRIETWGDLPEPEEPVYIINDNQSTIYLPLKDLPEPEEPVYIINDNQSTIYLPLKDLSDEEYASIRQRGFVNAWPTVIYDNGNYPVRELYVWPIPTTRQAVELWLWEPLQVYDLDAELDLPQGYERYLRFKLAIELAPEFGKEVTPDIATLAMEAEKNLKALNQQVPIAQLSAATSELNGRRGWNYLTMINGDVVPQP